MRRGRDPEPGAVGTDDEWLGDVDWDSEPVYQPRVQPSPAPEERHTEIGHAVRPEISRRRAVAVAVGLLVLVAGIGGLIIAFRGGSDTPAATTATTTLQTTTVPPATTATTPTTTTASAPAPVELPASGTMRRGETDSAKVKTLQAALAALGYTAVKVDGVFGSGTQAAVVAFQRAHNLPDDGIVGSATADAINAAVAQKG